MLKNPFLGLAVLEHMHVRDISFEIKDGGGVMQGFKLETWWH